MDISETRGVFKPISFGALIDATGRFDEEGRLTEIHNSIAKNAENLSRKHRLNPDGDFFDMFIHQVGNGAKAPVQVLGQMHPKALSDEAIRMTVATMIEAIKKGKLPEVDLAAGKEAIQRLYSAPVSMAALAVAKASIAQAALDENTGILTGNEWGTHDLPTEAPAGVTSGFKPLGYGSAAGLFTLASLPRGTPMANAIGDDLLDTATKFKVATEKLFDTLAPLFDEKHPAFSGEHVSTFFSSSHSEFNSVGDRNNKLLAFAQNLIDHPKAPLYALTGDAAPAAAAGPITGSLDAVDGTTDEEHAVLASARAGLANASVSREVRNVFSSSSSLAAFRAEYEASPFASTYNRFIVDKSADAVEKQQLRGNKSFTHFATRSLSQVLQSSGPQAAANLMHGIITAVREQTNVAAKNMESAIATFSATPAVSSSSSSSASSSSSSSLRGAVLTRFVHSATAIARAAPEVRAAFAPAQFHDVSAMVDTDDSRAVNEAERSGRSGIVSLFAHSAAGPVFTYDSNVSVGSKRKADAVYSGATRDEKYGADAKTVKIEITNFLENREKKAMPEGLAKTLYMAVLLAPVSKDTFMKWYENDIYVPLAIECARPFRRYETASAIFAVGGEQLGEIAWAKFDVHVSSNAMTKDFEGNASIWAAPIIKREERCARAHTALFFDFHVFLTLFACFPPLSHGPKARWPGGLGACNAPKVFHCRGCAGDWLPWWRVAQAVFDDSWHRWLL